LRAIAGTGLTLCAAVAGRPKLPIDPGQLNSGAQRWPRNGRPTNTSSSSAPWAPPQGGAIGPRRQSP